MPAEVYLLALSKPRLLHSRNSMRITKFREDLGKEGGEVLNAHSHKIPGITIRPTIESLQSSNDSVQDKHFNQPRGQCGRKSRPQTSWTWWTPEILAQVGGMACLTAIIIILCRVDGRPPPELFWGITLNTLLAFLTSLTKVAFLVPVVEGLGQLKWLWFLSPKQRPLIDFQVFDEGTRGGIGTLKLLFSFKGFLSSFGALIMLSGLFTSTLTQQAIAYGLVDAESTHSNDTATIDRATTFSMYDGSNALAIRPYDTLREQQAIFDGVTTPPTESIPQVRPNCASGQCTWPRYGSLAACGGVANLTAMGNERLLQRLRDITEKRLNVVFETANITAGAAGYGGFYQAISEAFPVIIGLLDGPTGAFNESVTALIASDSFVAYTDEMFDLSVRPFDMSKIKFLEIAFWWCTKTYETRVSQGQATTLEVSTISVPVDSSANNTLNVSWDPKFFPCYSTGKCNETYGSTEIVLSPPLGLPVNSTEAYSVNAWSGITGSHLIASTMLDSLLLDRTRGVISSNGGGVAKAFGFSLLGDFFATSVPLPETQLQNVRTVVQNTARSMTNLVREGTTRLGRDEIVKGTVFTPQSFVKVRWEWMAMLATQLVLTGVFLGITMGVTCRARLQVVKNSSLATLCALDEEIRRGAGGVGCLEGSQKWAKGVGVHLER
ncbi:hypothetical protein QBC44DRAFT_254497, partial [Cladorrhinum sp. PSN332]